LSQDEPDGLPFGRAATAVVAATAISASSSLFTIASAVAVCHAFDASSHYSILLILQRLGGGIGTLVGGGIVDRKGIKWVFRTGALIALVGAVLTASSPWFVAILGLRFVGGLGSGFCQAAAIATVPAVGRPGDRVRLFGASSATWGLSGVAVPFAVVTVSGLFGWRGGYGLEAALALFGLIAFPLAIRGATLRPPSLTGTFDAFGLALVSGAALAVQLILGWPAGIVATLPCALVLGSWYWWHAGRTPAPIFTRDQLFGRRILPFHAAGAMAFMGAWGINSFLPLVARDGLGASAALAALVLTLSSTGWLGGSLLTAGPLGSRSPRTLLLGAFAAQAVILTAGAAGLSTTQVGLLVGAVGVGLAGGVANNGSLALASATAEPSEVGRTLAALQFVRSVGSGAGGGAAGALIATLGPLPGLRAAQIGVAALTVISGLVVLRVTQPAVTSSMASGKPSTARGLGKSVPQVPAMASVATPPSTMAPPGPSS
jgi:MFS family permease